jgi:DNA-directed RNA polymerase subunit beta'
MKQLAGMRGLMAKPSGEIIETPIISNFKEGLSVLEYFNSTHGARKGLADTALKTANSGYLTRRLVDVAQDCIIVENDCGTTKGITVKEVLEGGDIIVPLSERILGRSSAKTVKDPVTGKKLFAAGTTLGEAEVDAAEKAGMDQLLIRSVLTCESKDGVCGICYGRDLARGTSVNIGEAVGVIAAQSIGEPGTQLTMRTFHIGGTAQHSEESSIETAHNATVTINNRSVVEDSQKRLVVMGRNVEVVLTDQGGHERARYKVPYGAVLRVDDGHEVKKGAKIAEWDPYTIPIISEISGSAGYRDVIEGIAMREIMDEATGISTQVIIDWRQQPKGDELKPRITLRDDKGKVLVLENGLEARYFLPVDAVLSVADGAMVHAGDVLARIPRESSKTRDITGGLPRVAELFEARKPKDHAIIAEIDGVIEFGKDYKAKRRIIVRPKDESLEPVEALIPKGKHIAVREGDFVHRGEPLLDGNPVPHDILKVMGVEALAKYLVDEVQDVYRLQGVKINDKHIEVIVRQMLQKVEVMDRGETRLLLGEQIDAVEAKLINEEAVADGKKPAVLEPVLQGITKASLQTSSFISAASFQETTRVLTEAAVSSRVDNLVGLKENVIVGRLIPAGTGGVMRRFKEVAADRDQVIVDARDAVLAQTAAAAKAEAEAGEADTGEESAA